MRQVTDPLFHNIVAAAAIGKTPSGSNNVDYIAQNCSQQLETLSCKVFKVSDSLLAILMTIVCNKVHLTVFIKTITWVGIDSGSS